MKLLRKAINRFLFEWQRKATNVHLRKASISIVSNFFKNEKAKGTHFLGNIDVTQHSKNLNVMGFTEFGVVFKDKEVEDLKLYLQGLELYNTYKPANNFRIENIPRDCNVASFKESDLIESDLIINLINDKSLLEIVRKSLGVTPTISGIGGWYSLSGRQSAKDAQLFHRDVDDFKFLKLFIYLTDVTRENGPHIYMAKSHNKSIGTKIRRYSDEEALNLFGEENLTIFERPKGSVFLVNTFGMHKGLLPIRDNRLLIQVQYSVLPIYTRKYTPIKKSENETLLDHYVNRLMFEF